MTQETETQIAAKYELMIILLHNLGEEDTKKELDEIRKNISSNGGEILHEDLWGIREFSYRFKKQEQGYYAVFNLSMDSEKVRYLEKNLNLQQSVLRYLIIKTPLNYEIKTLADYKAEEEAAEKEKKKAEKEEKVEKPIKKAKKRPSASTAREEESKAGKEEAAPVPKEETPEVPKPEEPAEETSVSETQSEAEEEAAPASQEATSEPKAKEVESEKEAKAKEKKRLDEVDEKLKSIINDPDISL